MSFAQKQMVAVFFHLYEKHKRSRYSLQVFRISRIVISLLSWYVLWFMKLSQIPFVALLIFSLSVNSFARQKTLPILKEEIERVEEGSSSWGGKHLGGASSGMGTAIAWIGLAMIERSDRLSAPGVILTIAGSVLGGAGVLVFGWDMVSEALKDKPVGFVKEQLAHDFPEEYQILLNERGGPYIEAFIRDVLSGWSLEKLDEKYGDSWPEALKDFGQSIEEEILFQEWLQTKTRDELARIFSPEDGELEGVSRAALKSYFLKSGEVNTFRGGFLED